MLSVYEVDIKLKIEKFVSERNIDIRDVIFWLGVFDILGDKLDCTKLNNCVFRNQQKPEQLVAYLNSYGQKGRELLYDKRMRILIINEDSQRVGELWDAAYTTEQVFINFEGDSPIGIMRHEIDSFFS